MIPCYYLSRAGCPPLGKKRNSKNRSKWKNKEHRQSKVSDCVLTTFSRPFYFTSENEKYSSKIYDIAAQ